MIDENIDWTKPLELLDDGETFKVLDYARTSDGRPWFDASGDLAVRCEGEEAPTWAFGGRRHDSLLRNRPDPFVDMWVFCVPRSPDRTRIWRYDPRGPGELAPEQRGVLVHIQAFEGGEHKAELFPQ